MSIIQEALKKAQADHAPGTQPSIAGAKAEVPAPQRRPSQPPSPAERKAAPRNAPRFVALGVVALMVIALASIQFMVASVKGPGSAGAPAVERPPQEVHYRSLNDAAAAVDKARYPELVLNGIMYLEVGPRAIINNTIVEENDMILGTRVLKINKKSVVLEYKDVEITLSLK